MANAAPTGRDLKAERVRSGLTQTQLGRLLGVSRQRVTAIEAQWRPSRAFADRVWEILKAVDRGSR